MTEHEVKGNKAGQVNGAEVKGSKGKRFLTSVLAVVAGIVASVGLLAVMTAGFTLSFDAIGAVAVAAHIAAAKAWMLPVSIDGAMLVASVHFVIARRLGGKGVYPLVVVVIGTLISVACNGLHATGRAGEPLDLGSGARFWVSTVPALMLALSVHMLVELLSHVTGVEPAPVELPALAEVTAAPALPAPPAEVKVSEPEAEPEPEVKVSAEPEVKAKPEVKVSAAREPRQVKVSERVNPALDDLATRRREHEGDLLALKALAADAGKIPPRDIVRRSLGISTDRAGAAIKSLRAEIDAGSFVFTATPMESAR